VKGKQIDINARESLFVSAERKGNRTESSVLWVTNGSPKQGWIGVAYRNPVDPEDVYLGLALATYRMMAGMNGEMSARLMVDRQLRNLFLKGQSYALNGFEE